MERRHCTEGEEVHHLRHPSHTSLETIIRLLQQGSLFKGGAIDGSKDPLAGDGVETDGTRPGNGGTSPPQQLAQRILAIGGIAEEGDGDEVVVLPIADEVDDGQELLARILSQSPPQLLDEDNGALGRSDHDNLVE